MGACLHRVRRQRWAVRAASAEQAFAIRTWLHDHCDGDLKSALETAFDRVAPGEQVVRLERLVLRLRVDDIRRVGETLPARVFEALTPLGPEATNGLAPAAPAIPPPTGEEQLIEYLLSGSVPWPVRPDSLSVVPSFAAIARASAPAIAAVLAKRAPDRRVLATAIFRLLQLVDENAWAEIVDAAGGGTRLLEQVPARARATKSAPREVAAPDRHLRLVVSRLIDERSRARSDGSLDADVAGRPRALETDEWAGIGLEPAPDDACKLSPRPVAVSQPPGAIVESAARDARGEAVADRGPVSSTFPIAVAYAGLVLLHPFLPQCFQALGLNLGLESDPDSAAVARAAALLNFIATGRDEPFEMQLGLVKILLGLSPDTPVPVGAGLISDAAREEAGVLLDAAIEHWGALKQTSAEAVRTFFLQRPGLVTADENGWRLLVEPGPFDVLMKRLPWSLVLVKLPWMHTPLHCEWPTL